MTDKQGEVFVDSNGKHIAILKEDNRVVETQAFHTKEAASVLVEKWKEGSYQLLLG